MRISKRQAAIALGLLTLAAFASFGMFQFARYEKAKQETAKADQLIQEALDENLQDIRDNLGVFDDLIKMAEAATNSGQAAPGDGQAAARESAAEIAVTRQIVI